MSTKITENPLYEWSDIEQQEILPKIASMFDLPKNQANDIAVCVLTKILTNPDPSRYNYDQVTELIFRVKNGGELSKDLWEIVLECLQSRLPRVQYVGKRIPNMLIQRTLEQSGR